MKELIGQILPLALVITFSPLNIIPGILLLFGTLPTRKASAFLLGFVAGVGGVLAVLTVLAGALTLSNSSHASWGNVIKLGLGIYLLVAAVRKFHGRPQGDEEGALPAWMSGLSEASPLRSLEIGVLLGAANPKNIVMSLAAGATVSASGLPVVQQLGAGAVYVLLASAGVAAPLLTTLTMGDRAPTILEQWDHWLRRNNATVMAALFCIFGVVLIGQGLAGK